MYELIISEKPNAAKRIADALADGKAIKENNKGAPYYKLTHGKKDIIVACAVGHLYGLEQKDSKGKKWVYPVFDIEWKPSSESKKAAAYTKKYLQTIKKLAKDANEFTVATDYDIEGEVIGLNIIRYAAKKKDANRMKFSTLTKNDLIKSYENKLKHLDWPQANAGETRHFLDWFNGINYSRALTDSIKKAGSFKIMSIGRVQGPALKIIVEREKEIAAFIPVKFWQIELNGDVKNGPIIAWHKEDKFWEKKKVNSVMRKIKDEKKAIISDVKKSQFKQASPFPFDLTTLQVEAYRCHGIHPKITLEIAQELYTSGYISYPRTSSQQLPKEIGLPKIFDLLKRQDFYKEYVEQILQKPLTPNNGKKTDPAHPAIYPTGLIGHIDGRAANIYDLIVRRFLATFGDPATRETMIININCKDEPFVVKGTRTIDKGWHVYYGPYVKIEEIELPSVEKNDEVNVKKIELHAKETQPPKRYTPSSIIKELEKKNLGTKATRANIVDTLFQRAYVDGSKSINATELGKKTIETLEKHVPKIIDEELTKNFEERMEEIREGKIKPEKVLDTAKDAVTKVIKDFKKQGKEIGEELKKANFEARDTMNTLGPCPKCKKGTLMMRRGKFGTFAACNKYPKCKTTFSLPRNALIKPSDKTCETCGFPMVLAIKRGKRPSEFCLNPECKSKYLEGEAGKEAKAIAKGEKERDCPQCKDGKLVLRKSIYGSFLACDKYPKCKYTEKLENNK